MKIAVSNILKVIDIEQTQLTPDFLSWLNLYADRAYEDKILKEHLYGCELIEEIEQFIILPPKHRATLQTISNLCRDNDAGYFRIISH